jgi:hypothetical protein
VIIDEDNYLAHYGVIRRSGRYPWGSGGNVPGTYQRNASFLDIVNDLRKQGVSDTDICIGMGIGSTDRNGNFRPSTTQLRAKYTIARNELKQSQITQAQRLKDKGLSNNAIAEKMGLAGESSVRALLSPGAREKAAVLTATADMIKRQVDEKTYLDVGSGNENYIGVSKEKLAAAIAILKEQGYVVHTVPVPQLGTGKDTHQKVLAPPGTTWGDVRRNQDNIKSIVEFSEDGGLTFGKVHEPLSINPKRVAINYAEDGGDQADGVIYVRPGVKDVEIGNKNYGQVRVKVGDDHYLKGMAIYKDDLPDGVDLLFNTNKNNTGNKFDAMKKISDDPELPFGSIVRQKLADPGTPNERVTSVMNLVGSKEGAGEEGSWETWSKTLSSQMLSKQSPKLAKEQLAVTFERRQREFDEIMSLTNPTIKRKLLDEFAASTDAASVHLKAAQMPRQNTRVLLPMNSIKPTEVYAPGYKDGEKVALIRFPHGGTFEIPELTVNNKHAPGKKLLGDARDAIGIHHKVAERLSGADFDGDTVLVIPNNQGKIKTSPPLEGLKNFNPKIYAPYDGMKTMDGGVYNAKTKTVDYGGRKPSGRTKGREMGDVSNLITDMTIQAASHEEIARAVRHSMVVIDAEKHVLNWKQSALDNNIKELKVKYQGGARAGASTLISRKKQTVEVPARKLRPASQGGPIDKKTGRRMYVETGATKVNRDGVKVPRTEKVKKLDLTDDAHTLSSGTPMERLYADHSNRLKSLANQARLEAIKTPPLKYSPSAKKVYAKEEASLSSKLALAERNAPRERQAQVLANAKVRAKKQANPDLDPDTLKKIKYQALDEARARLGAKKQKIEITKQEWDAIQAGAISNHKLERILKNTDTDVVRSLATPKKPLLMTPALTTRAQSMLKSGYTRADVADLLGVSLSTLDEATNG